jgi:hypothetical protein
MMRRHLVTGLVIVTRAAMAEILALAARVGAVSAAERRLQQASARARAEPEDDDKGE